ncbi:MAG TPA: TIGR01777 family oxidoreductase [Gracilimonas sp.]|uniref:TIGR01777 family oxidoreductase n=1 Tax=Gracilimonas sp. TaxID=1974203 RepID=UPI002DAC66A2|nr:TIGR01777 family oxidoreductase [Gracilimonas sp.]
MNILITGGTGFIGDELRTLLLKKGHDLVIVTRNPKEYEDENARNQRFIAWDDDLVATVNNVDAVINLAGENIFAWRWTPEKKERILNSRIRVTTRLVEAMVEADNKPKVFISASGASIYGDRGDEVLSESEAASDDFLASVCVKWESESQKASELGIRVVNPRIGVVLEEGGGALEKMIPPFQFFVGGPIGSGDQYMSWIHRTDLCRSFIFALENEQVKGAYNACSPNPVTMGEFSEILGAVMNRPAIFKVPEFAINLVMGEVAKTVTDSIRMQPKNLQVNGFDFHFEELEEALADIV